MNPMQRVKKIVKDITWLKPLYSRNARMLLKLRLLGVSPDLEDAEGAGAASGVRRRHYASYTAYLEHQKSKLTMLKSGDRHGVDRMDLDSYDVSYRQHLADRFRGQPELPRGAGVLCLAARIGTEVKAFHDLGCFAVGIDLNPGPDNAYVLPGDFHHLVFPDGSVDVVFCNSLDHAFDLGRLITEIRRVLRSGGHFIAEIPHGSEEAAKDNTGYWESTSWTRAREVVEIIATHGLEEVRTVDDPHGRDRTTYVFRRAPESGAAPSDG